MKKRFLSLFISITVCAALAAGCGTAAPEATQTPTEAPSPTPTPHSAAPLVIGYQDFSGVFNPFFAESDSDKAVVGVMFTPLLTTDRAGAVVYNAIEGETRPYNGTDYTYTGIADVAVNYDKTSDISTYTWTLRDSVKFSDGEALSADDVIFSYYVYCDPSYSGSANVGSLPVVGLHDYRTQTSSSVWSKYNDMFDAIYVSMHSQNASAADSWTAQQQSDFDAAVESEWKKDIQAVVDYSITNYLSFASSDYFPGFTPEQVSSTPGLDVALGMAMSNFGSVSDGVLTAPSGKTFDLEKGIYPSADDFYQETYEKYGGDPAAYDAAEPVDGTTVTGEARAAFIAAEAANDPDMAGGIPNITGIKKLSDTQVEVKLSGYNASDIYTLDIPVAPMHYYGDAAKYDYANNKFGFDFGDLRGVRGRTAQPIGAGPYRFVKYENDAVYFEGNDYYYNSAPATWYMQFKKTAEEDMAAAVANGDINIAGLPISGGSAENIKGFNSNGELSGDKLYTSLVYSGGFGYLGMNASTLNVGGDPGSEQSKDLRKGFATLLAVYREKSVSGYFGEGASVIDYPVSQSYWAAPQSVDEGYQAAFSSDADGSPVYTADMTDDQRYAAALQAATGFFKAAGYTFSDSKGKFTAAPEGAKLSYEVIIVKGSSGSHPCLDMLESAKAALESIGLDITINDTADAYALNSALDAGTQEMWCSAGPLGEPDMYNAYYSGGAATAKAPASNYFSIRDNELDSLILDIQSSTDQSDAKELYAQAFDRILGWAVEIPVYQRLDCVIYSATAVKPETVTPDITATWPWWKEAQQIELAVS